MKKANRGGVGREKRGKRILKYHFKKSQNITLWIKCKCFKVREQTRDVFVEAIWIDTKRITIKEHVALGVEAHTSTLSGAIPGQLAQAQTYQ